MEWNGKWDWENLVLFGSKTAASPNKPRLTDWGMEDGGDIDTRSFSLSTVVGGSGCSASDIGYNSSSKSSISASTESSVKDGVRKSDIAFKDLGGFSVDLNKKKGFAEGELNGNPPSLQASVGSVEPLIGLKLGKRTYFENTYAKNNISTFSSSAAAPVSSISTVKKVKSGYQSTPTPRCQVEGCNLDLSSAKEYHKKHRVCESHSKSPKVIVGGLELRFCQQCSRFHSLIEFDENKRSCRRRLSEHNARRRKPQQETIQFNSNIPSSFYDGEQQLSFMLNNVPVVQSGHVLGPTWESACCSKCTVDKFKAERVGGLNCPGMQCQHALSITDQIFDGISSSKGSRDDSLDQGFKESASSNIDAALDLRRALSLLSNNSWGSSVGPEFITFNQQIHANHAIVPQHGTHAVSQALVSSAEFCQVDQQAVAKASSKSINQFQEVPPFKPPFEAYFYSNLLE